MPRKWFGSAVCVQRDGYSVRVYIIAKQSADPNHFRGTAGITIERQLYSLAMYKMKKKRKKKFSPQYESNENTIIY